MSRKRQTNKHLFPGMRLKCGTYYFEYKKKIVVDDKTIVSRKWIKLGKTEYEAYAKLAQLKLLEFPEKGNMNEIIDRYMVEVSPKKAPKTYKENLREARNLKYFFGKMNIDHIKPVNIYRYLDVRGEESKAGANREVALLSHIFTKAIRWGAAEYNPCLGIEKHPESRRNRNVKEEEFWAIHSCCHPIMQCLLEFFNIVGLRRADPLQIKLSDIKDGVIHCHIGKAKKEAEIEITPEIQTIIDRAIKTARGLRIISIYLFPNKYGRAYTPDGFSSNFQTARAKAIEKGILSESFRLHDIRHKVGTEADRREGREYARQLLGHQSQTTTERYLDGPLLIKPLKKVSVI